MSSRRGVMKVNSVTGKMERMTEEDSKKMEGKTRDGCLLVDDRYINAAKELGLGGQDGMYGHIKSLSKLGKGAGDIHEGQSMQREGSKRDSSAIGTHDLGGKKVGGSGAANSAAGGSTSASSGTDGVSTMKKGVANVHGFGGGSSGSASNTDHAMSTMSKDVSSNTNVHGFNTSSSTAGAMKTTAKAVASNTNVHGFGGTGAGNNTAKHHNTADSFQRRKGVVNTFGGAKDTTRAPREDELKLPPKGERKAHIMGIDMLDAHTAEGKARREGIEKREKAGGNAYKNTMVHVSGGGGRIATLDNPKGKSGSEGRPTPADVFKAKMAKAEALNGPAPRHSMGSSSHFASMPTQTTVNRLGSGSSSSSSSSTAASSRAEEGKENSGSTSGGVKMGGSGGGGNADDVRAKRAAHFEKLAAEAAAKRAAGAAILNA
jgi:hypothetical protein